MSEHSHGNNENEILRGQRKVEPKDYVKIPDVIGNPDSIEGSYYKGRNAAVFTKTLGSERFNVFAVDSGGKSVDLFVQTFYINKKGSIAGAVDAKNAPTLTSETTTGTASDEIIADTAAKSQGQKSLALDDSTYLSLAEKFRAGSATEAETEQLQKAVEEAAKKENKCEYCVKCLENTSNCAVFR